MVSKRKNKAPQKEKRGTSHGENKTHSFVVSMQGGGRCGPRGECDYIKCTMFPEIIHHIIISKYTLEYTQLNFFFKIFSEKHTLHTLESSSNKIEQRYTHVQHDQQRKPDVLQYLLISSKITHTPV